MQLRCCTAHLATLYLVQTLINRIVGPLVASRPHLRFWLVVSCLLIGFFSRPCTVIAPFLLAMFAFGGCPSCPHVTVTVPREGLECNVVTWSYHGMIWFIALCGCSNHVALGTATARARLHKSFTCIQIRPHASILSHTHMCGRAHPCLLTNTNTRPQPSRAATLLNEH